MWLASHPVLCSLVIPLKALSLSMIKVRSANYLSIGFVITANICVMNGEVYELHQKKDMHRDATLSESPGERQRQ